MVEIISQREPIDPHIPNRRAELLAYIDQELHANSGQVAVVTLDLEDLKDYNDTAGHDIGDQKLARTLELLLANVRTKSDSGATKIPWQRHPDVQRQQDPQRHPDTILRYGRAWHASGDEYWLLLYDVHEQEDVDAFTARLQGILEQEGINASMGGLLHREGQTADQLMRDVDTLERQNKRERALRYAAGNETRLTEMIQELHEMGISPRRFAKIAAAMKPMGHLALHSAVSQPEPESAPGQPGQERAATSAPGLEDPAFFGTV